MSKLQLFMRIAGIEKESMVDGPGMRNTLFLQGCDNHCEGCHNKHTWDIDGGEVKDVFGIIDEAHTPLIDGITLSGGDPYYYLVHKGDLYNSKMEQLLELEKFCCEKYNDNLIVYTGYEPDELVQYGNDYINNTVTFTPKIKLKNKTVSVCTNILNYERIRDVNNTPMYYRVGRHLTVLSKPKYLVTGRYMQELRSMECLFRGSTNQGILSLKIAKWHPLTLYAIDLTKFWDEKDIETSDEIVASFKYGNFIEQAERQLNDDPFRKSAEGAV